MGVSAYSTAGGKLWYALDEESVWWLDAAGCYVYVPGPGDDPSTVRDLEYRVGDERVVLVTDEVEDFYGMAAS